MIEKTPFFVPNNWYAITIAPKDKYQFFTKADRESKFKNLFNEIILRYPKLKIEYYFALELSEPVMVRYPCTGPRLHLHGILKFTTRKGLKEWLLIESLKLYDFGILEIKPVIDMDDWLSYCNKQQDIMNYIYMSNLELYPPLDGPKGDKQEPDQITESMDNEYQKPFKGKDIYKDK